MFYNARWYDPALSRFAQADSIVPAGVQGLDRYAYVNNNPLRYTDPTGHICQGQALVDGERCAIKATPASVLAMFGVILTNGTANWDTRDALAALSAIVDVAVKMGAKVGRTAIDAFRIGFKTYVQPLEIRKMANYPYFNENTQKWDTATDGGLTVNSHLIYLTRLAQPSGLGGYHSDALAFAIARNNIVHELGHAFASSNPGVGNNIPGSLVTDNGWPAKIDGGGYLWRQHPCSWDPVCKSSEVYADMFLGWVYNTWSTDILGSKRMEYMTTDMTTYWSTR